MRARKETAADDTTTRRVSAVSATECETAVKVFDLYWVEKKCHQYRATYVRAARQDSRRGPPRLEEPTLKDANAEIDNISMTCAFEICRLRAFQRDPQL